MLILYSFSILFIFSAALDASDHMYISARDADLINASFKLDDTQEDSFKLDATQEESGLEQTINTTAEIDFVEPSYMDLIDINRVQACVIAGKSYLLFS